MTTPTRQKMSERFISFRQRKRSGIVLCVFVCSIMVLVRYALFDTTKTSHPQKLCRRKPSGNEKKEGITQVSHKKDPSTATSNFPQCSRGLVVKLIHSTSSDDTGKRLLTKQGTNLISCLGFLLRDDAVLTTRACAKDVKAVSVPGHGKWLVVSKTKSLDFNVAVLSLAREVSNATSIDVGNEYVYHKNSGWPRRRIFLNHGESIFRLNNDISGKARFVKVRLGLHCSKDGTPILTAFVGNEKGDKVPVNLLRARRGAQDAYSILIQDVLHVEQDSKDAIAEMSNDELGERWWVRKKTKGELDHQFRETRRWYADVAYNKSKTALSVERGLGTPGVLELEDPKRRHRRCLRWYFGYWSQRDTPFSGEPFFQWLDYGSGRNFEHPSCSREKLNSRHVKLFNTTERKKAKVKFNIENEGNTVRLSFAKTSKPLPSGKWLFVWGTDKKLYVAKELSNVKHVSLLGGEPVLHAGELKVVRDRLYSINAASGHYRPKVQNVRSFFLFLRRMGMNRQAIEWEYDREHFSEGEWNTVFT